MTTYGDILKANPSLTTQQGIFIYHLRVNPHDVTQITMSLEDSTGMCALGLGMEAFGILRTFEQFKERFPEKARREFGSGAFYDPYQKIADILSVERDVVNDIYWLNDSEGMSFGQIADLFEKYLTSDRSVSIRKLLWNERNAVKLEKQAVFAKTWNKYKAQIQELNKQASAELGVTAFDGSPSQVDIDDWQLEAEEAFDYYGDDNE